MVVSSVIAARPDLVYGARRARSATQLEVRSAEVAGVRTRTLVLSPGCWPRWCSPASRASTPSSHPDGLEYVAEQTGFLDTADDSSAADGPMADYAVTGVDSPRLAGGLAGVVGVLVTLGLAGGVAYAVRRRQPDRDRAADLGTGLMGAGHGHRLHYHGHSPVHRAEPHLKILALLGFVLLVVATPREWYLAYPVYLAVLLAVIAFSRVPFGYLLPRLVVELPFVVFALLLPFIALGPAGRGARDRAERARPARGVGPARQGDPGRPGVPHAGRHHRA